MHLLKRHIDNPPEEKPKKMRHSEGDGGHTPALQRRWEMHGSLPLVESRPNADGVYTQLGRPEVREMFG